MHFFDNSLKKKNSKTTLTIVQDFPKKKIGDAQITANNVDLVQGKNTQGDIKIVDDSKNKVTTLNIV